MTPRLPEIFQMEHEITGDSGSYLTYLGGGYSIVPGSSPVFTSASAVVSVD